jgi:hypothetical protein
LVKDRPNPDVLGSNAGPANALLNPLFQLYVVTKGVTDLATATYDFCKYWLDDKPIPNAFNVPNVDINGINKP